MKKLLLALLFALTAFTFTYAGGGEPRGVQPDRSFADYGDVIENYVIAVATAGSLSTTTLLIRNTTDYVVNTTQLPYYPDIREIRIKDCQGNYDIRLSTWMFMYTPYFVGTTTNSFCSSSATVHAPFLSLGNGYLLNHGETILISPCSSYYLIASTTAAIGDGKVSVDVNVMIRRQK